MQHAATEMAITPWRASVGDDEVLAAVSELCERYHAPSTSLIAWRLADGGAVTAALQAAVLDSLRRLLALGELSFVTHRGTERWGVAPAPDRR